MHVKNITEKMYLLKMSGPQIWLCLFTFRPIASKQLNCLTYNRYSQLTQWCSGNASALGERGPRFNPRLRRRFLCLIFCSVVFLFFVQKHIIYHKILQFLLQCLFI